MRPLALTPLVLVAVTSAVLVQARPARGDDKLSKSVAERLEAARGSLVSVELTSRVSVERLPGLGEGARRVVRTESTGIVVSDDGLVVLAASRVDPAAPTFALLGARARPEVEKVLVVGSDGKPREATWVGRDAERGLAFVRVALTGRVGLTPMAIPDVATGPGLGDDLVVVSLTSKALGRAPRADVTRVAFLAEKPRKLLGTSPSPSQALGGLVYRLEGAVGPVGIVVGLPGPDEPPPASDSAGKDVLDPSVLAAQSAAYVLPSADLHAAIARPPVEGKVTAVTRRARSWIGIKPETLTPELAKAHGLPTDEGVRVVKVYKDTPADKAGIAANDVITRLDGELVSLDPGESFRSLEDLGVGQKVKLTVFREGKGRELELQLGEAPLSSDDAPRARLQALEGVARDLTFFDRDERGLGANVGGAIVLDLDADGAGSRAGLRVNDLVLQVDGKDVPSADGLREALGEAGERTLSVQRGTEKLALKLRR